MRTIRLARLTFVFLATVLALTLQASAAEASPIHAVLITATNLKRESDPKLRAYEADLQRNIPLSSFRYVSEGSTSVGGNGQPATLTLSGGHRLVLQREKGEGPTLQVRVQWFAGRELMLATSLTVPKGGTGVLIRRPPGDEETPIVLVIAK